MAPLENTNSCNLDKNAIKNTFIFIETTTIQNPMFILIICMVLCLIMIIDFVRDLQITFSDNGFSF